METITTMYATLVTTKMRRTLGDVMDQGRAIKTPSVFDSVDVADVWTQGRLGAGARQNASNCHSPPREKGGQGGGWGRGPTDAPQRS